MKIGNNFINVTALTNHKASECLPGVALAVILHWSDRLLYCILSTSALTVLRDQNTHLRHKYGDVSEVVALNVCKHFDVYV